MKNLISKLLSNKLNSSNLRTKVRIVNNIENPIYLMLKDKNNKQIRVKLIDHSYNGCRIIVPNMKLFEEGEYSITFDEKQSFFPSAHLLKAQVVWSKTFQIEGSRYCTTGLLFKPIYNSGAEWNQISPTI